MNRQLTFQQYRAIDLGLFSLMLCVSEAIVATAARAWFPDQLYTVSVTGAMVAIVLMRWGAYAAIHAVLGGVIYCLASQGTPIQYLIYCAGNLFGLAALALLRVWGRERIRNSAVNSVAYALAVLLLMQAGRALVAWVTGAPLESCLGFFTTDALSLLFTGVVVWIARRLDGIFEDQKHYLLRIHAEGEEKGGY